jgi:hypothetical protein
MSKPSSQQVCEVVPRPARAPPDVAPIIASLAQAQQSSRDVLGVD